MKKELTLADFQLPDTMELEYKVLASAITSVEYFGDILRIVRPEFFSKPENRKVWDVVVEMFEKGETIDNMSVFPRVDRTNFSHHILAAEPSYGQSVIALALSLQDTYIKRKAYFAALEVLQGVERGETAEEVTGRFRGFSESIGEELRDNSASPATEVANALADDIQAGNLRRVQTPFHTLNYLLYGGFGGGNLVILSARPSVGKTTISLQMAQHAARVGEKVCYYSLEMTKKDLVQRLIIGTGRVSAYDIYSGSVDWAMYEAAVSEALSPNLTINDTARSLDDLCAKILLAARSKECTIAFIDYLGLIRYSARGKTQAQIMGDITSRLKSLAMDAGIPVVLLCQLNRESTKEGRSPQLTDLRDSGAIEQDADIVIMMERPRDDMGNITERSIDLWLRKNRNGNCTFDSPIRLEGNQSYFSFKEARD